MKLLKEFLSIIRLNKDIDLLYYFYQLSELNL